MWRGWKSGPTLAEIARVGHPKLSQGVKAAPLRPSRDAVTAWCVSRANGSWRVPAFTSGEKSPHNPGECSGGGDRRPLGAMRRCLRRSARSSTLLHFTARAITKYGHGCALRRCAGADAQKVAQLEQLRKQLDPFQLSRGIERKLEHISRLANRRLSPKAAPETAPERTLAASFKRLHRTRAEHSAYVHGSV